MQNACSLQVVLLAAYYIKVTPHMQIKFSQLVNRMYQEDDVITI